MNQIIIITRIEATTLKSNTCSTSLYPKLISGTNFNKYVFIKFFMHLIMITKQNMMKHNFHKNKTNFISGCSDDISPLHTYNQILYIKLVKKDNFSCVRNQK